MRLPLLSYVLLSSFLLCNVGCKKESAPPATQEDKTATPPAPAPTPMKPFTGPLTRGLLEQGKTSIKPFEPWQEAFARLSAIVGPATKVNGATHGWYVKDGEDCVQLEVEKTDKGEVGAISFQSVNKSMAEQFAKCESGGSDNAPVPGTDPSKDGAYVPGTGARDGHGAGTGGGKRDGSGAKKKAPGGEGGAPPPGADPTKAAVPNDKAAAEPTKAAPAEDKSAPKKSEGGW